MIKLLSALHKETLILVRDVPGLLILFIMPVMLILVVIVAQQNAMKSSRESRSEVLFIAESHSDYAKQIEANLDSSGLFSLVKMHAGNLLDEKTASALLLQSKYPLCIILPDQDTVIRVLIDPALQESYRNSLIGSMTYIIKGTQSRIAIEEALNSMAPGMEEVVQGVIRSSVRNMAPISEEYVAAGTSTIKPTLSQNSIPGFILFAMFFIVIPLSGSLITEKSEGSYLRLKTLPVPMSLFLSSKVVLYLGVCLLQFLLMVMTGLWLLPGWFGYPAFHMGDQYLAIILTTLATALAAIGFGLMVGTGSSTHGQAALFGSVMVVILGIISGTFLPIHLFPEAIQAISSFSPVRWGIDNYLDLFIRNGSLIDILPNILFLLLFFVFAMVISVHVFARRK